jgi:hypothetical protein
VKLLKEYRQINFDQEMIKEYQEAEKEGRPIVVKGVIQKADEENQNHRVYPYDILKPKVEKYIKEFVEEGVAIGELDHTDSPIVEGSNASHIIRKIWWEGKDVWGDIELLDTPKGKICQEFVKKGIPLGISSRAIGSIDESSKTNTVKEDLEFICWDTVIHPSTNDAYLRLYEARDLGAIDISKCYPVSVRLKNTLSEILKRK